MPHIQHLAELQFDGTISAAEGREANTLLSRAGQRVFEIKLSNEARLAKHSAASPITVLCLGGQGVFRAGDELAEEQPLRPGTLIALDADVAHEVCAEPSLHLLVTKF